MDADGGGRNKLGATPADWPYTNGILPTTNRLSGGALAKGHPFGLLALASYMLWRAEPDPLASFESPPREPLDIDNVLTGFIADKCRETTAILAVLAELM